MEELRWQYRPEWCAWWLVVCDGGPTVTKGYGPFNDTEAKRAAEEHGVPFPPLPQGEQKK